MKASIIHICSVSASFGNDDDYNDFCDYQLLILFIIAHECRPNMISICV